MQKIFRQQLRISCIISEEKIINIINFMEESKAHSFEKKPKKPILGQPMTVQFCPRKVPFYAKDPERTALLYCEITPTLEKYSAVDICIVCDVTGSMNRYKELVANSLNLIMFDATAIFSFPPRFAFIGFRDKKDKDQIYKYGFTLSVDELQQFIKSIDCTGGGDECEDLVTPMKEALTLNWRSDCLLVCLVLDAPTHGRSYHDDTDTDYYLDDDKEQLLEKLCVHYKRNRINLVVLKCNNSVDMMIEKMKIQYNSKINKMIVIDLKEGEMRLKEKFGEIIKKEISQAFSKSIYSNFRKIKPAFEDSQLVYWEADKANIFPFKANIYSGFFEKNPHYEKLSFDYQLKVKKNLEDQMYSISSSELAAGTFKTCHQLFLESNPNEKYVAKIPKEPAEKPSALISEIEGNVFASYFALNFNNLLKRNLIKILPLVIMEITDEAYKQPLFGRSKCILAQKYLDGEYVKYNNNYGWVNSEESDWNLLAQAFSHYTYEASLGTLMLIDIQGMVSNDVFTLTDPAIHAVLYKGHFGDTNQGKIGFMKFFKTHVCNKYCKSLKLTDPKILAKDELAKIQANHAANKILEHVYGNFEKNFDTCLKKIREFDPKKLPVLEPIKEELTEDEGMMQEYEDLCRTKVVEEEKSYQQAIQLELLFILVSIIRCIVEKMK
eukprot:TRINITY_DN827_c1_g1_i2.p2 TRINITY_DN827_c1_g1~~TRINITY_DN827_c1_g1_i2.p2  ORF type:complete len:665 (-),score=86.35 TRINITY_DN827_c1_g1_i2:8474-10468(-)